MRSWLVATLVGALALGGTAGFAVARTDDNAPGRVSLASGRAAVSLQLRSSVCWSSASATLCADQAAPPPGGFLPTRAIAVRPGGRLTLTTPVPAQRVALRGYRGSTLNLNAVSSGTSGRRWTFTAPAGLARRTTVVAFVSFAQGDHGRPLMYGPTVLVRR